MFSFLMYYCCNLKYVGIMSLYTNGWRALGTIPGCSFLFLSFDEGLQIPMSPLRSEQRWDTDTCR